MSSTNDVDIGKGVDMIAGSLTTGESESPAPEVTHPWYAVRVRSNFERTVSRSLQNKGYVEFAPFYRAKRRWSDRTKLVEFPLFPGYVFCRFNVEQRLPILQTPGVVSVVGFGEEFAVINDAEINAVRRVITSGNEVRPWPYLRVGQHVRVRAGALAGLDGLLLDLKNGCRIVVSITILQRSVATELDRDTIEPL